MMRRVRARDAYISQETIHLNDAARSLWSRRFRWGVVCCDDLLCHQIVAKDDALSKTMTAAILRRRSDGSSLATLCMSFERRERGPEDVRTDASATRFNASLNASLPTYFGRPTEICR